MSRDGKGWQIIQRLFTKVALVISDARENHSSTRNGAKVDKWFQLEVTDDGRFSGVNQALKDLGTQGNMEMRVRVVLTLGSLEPAKALVLLTDQRRTRIELAPETSAILLEEWRISLDKSVSESGGDDPYPGVYKQAIALVRSLYALLRHLPAWQLRRGLSAASSIRVELFVSLVGSADDVEHEEILGLDHKLVPDEPAPSTFAFPAIATPLGPITLKVQYRPNVRVRLDPLESLWSSAFANTTAQGSTSPASPPPAKVDLDAHAFTPTLLANRQRASLSGSNTPLRTGTSPGTQPPTPIRPRTTSQLSAGGDLSRSPPSELAGPSGLARTRRESLLTRGVAGSVTGAPPSPRRTPTAINAFKSGTLASSPRLGGLAGNSPRTTPGLGLGTPPRGAAGTSPLSVAAGSSPRSDGRRSIEGDGTGAQPQPIKRYSSSFGHRRDGSLGARVAGTPERGEAGSTGSGGTGSERHRLSTIGSQSYATEKDDHDLSLFIKDIDTYRAHGLGGSPLGLTEQFPLDSPEPPERRESFPSTNQEQFPSLSPMGERFPPSSLPTRFPTFSPLGRGYLPQTESPRPLPLPLESVPPSPAESAYVRDRTSRPASRERFRSGERRLSIDNRYGVRGPSESRERRPMEVLAPLPERHLDERGLNLADRIGLEERTRTMSLGPSRQPLFPEYERSRTTSLTPSHERERTTSFARSRALLTSRGDVEAALQLMNADFEASYTPARTGQTGSSRGLHVGSSPGDQPPAPRRIGSQEVVGRLELSGSGLGLGTRGSVRPGRDTDGWSEGGEWDQRRSGWR